MTDSDATDPAGIPIFAAIIRRLDLDIRNSDAINLAVALRLGATIATLGRCMANKARPPGVAVTTV